MNTVLEVANVEKYYGNKGNLTKALDKISFRVVYTLLSSKLHIFCYCLQLH